MSACFCEECNRIEEMCICGEPSANTTQVGGDHYRNKAIQPWDFIHQNGIGFIAGCVIKYCSRYKEKGGVEDLRKARHFLDKLIELESPA